SCHHPTDADRKAGRGASYRGLPRKCGGCHDDPHLGQFRLTEPVLECDACHSTSAFKIASFDHASLARWELTGAHAKTTCSGCHMLAVLAKEQKTVRWRLPSADCQVCHANPHTPRGSP